MVYRAPISPVFRPEALAHHGQGGAEGPPLAQVPAWTRAAFVLLVAAVVVTLAFSLAASVDEYAAGPAVVQVTDRRDVVATEMGTVLEVAVEPGGQVAAGDVLVRLDDASLVAERDRLVAELQARLVEVLRDPDDEAKRRSLATLRSDLGLAEERLAHRTIRAPSTGMVVAVRARPGQRVGPGDALVSIVAGGGDASVVALLPGRYRPLLQPGMQIRLSLDGFSYAHQWLTIESLDAEIVGPEEARRILGPAESDAVDLPEPVVIVQARLHDPSFHADGSELRYFDGLRGTAEVTVRRERILVAAVPALRWLWSDTDGP